MPHLSAKARAKAAINATTATQQIKLHIIAIFHELQHTIEANTAVWVHQELIIILVERKT